MKRFFILVLLTAAIVSFVEPVAAQFRSSVAQVFVEEQGRGTGFFVTRQLIMTNKHVVATKYSRALREYTEFADTVIVRHGGVSLRAVVADVSDTHDLALVMVRGRGPRPFRFCETVDFDDDVEIWTFDFGRFKVKEGDIRDYWGDVYITSVPVVNGNSGSPLIQRRGLRKCIAGVTFARYVSSGEGLHVSGVIAKEFLDDFLARLKGGE